MRRFINRLLSVFRSDRADEELTREMASHLALLEEAHRRRGLTPDEARLAARRSMGSVALVKDLHRDARSFVRLEDLGRDFRHAVRTLRRAPGFTLIAVFALGLGIGVNTTFFTLVNAICLRGLPIESPERVMYLSTRDAKERPGNLSYLEFDELRTRRTAFEQVAAYTITVAVVADPRQPPARVSAAYMSAGSFELLGDRPVLGRAFRADGHRCHAARVHVSSERRSLETDGQSPRHRSRVPGGATARCVCAVGAGRNRGSGASRRVSDRHVLEPRISRDQS